MSLFLLKLSEFHYMLIIEVIVDDGVIIECIILRGISNALATYVNRSAPTSAQPQ